MLSILSRDALIIPYRKELNQITKSVTATILFSQILFRFEQNGSKPFYKFKQPCSHDKYRDGDSWCEELGFTLYEFDGAIKRISKKINKAQFQAGDFPSTPIYYFINADRVTYYGVNIPVATAMVESVYVNGKFQDRVNGKFPFTYKVTENTIDKKEILNETDDKKIGSFYDRVTAFEELNLYFSKEGNVKALCDLSKVKANEKLVKDFVRYFVQTFFGSEWENPLPNKSKLISVFSYWFNRNKGKVGGSYQASPPEGNPKNFEVTKTHILSLMDKIKGSAKYNAFKNTSISDLMTSYGTLCGKIINNKACGLKPPSEADFIRTVFKAGLSSLMSRLDDLLKQNEEAEFWAKKKSIFELV